MSHRWLLALTGALVLAACGGGDGEQARGTPIAPAQIADSAEVADLTRTDGDPTVLTVRGASEDDDVTLGLSQIEQLERIRVPIDDPFELRRITYEGVWLADLLDLLAVPADATLRFRALDDYAIALERGDVRRGDVLLATRVDGAQQAVVDGGPIRLVFADPSGPGQNPDLWIWSIDELAVG